MYSNKSNRTTQADPAALESLYEEALVHFPYPLYWTSVTQGELEPDPSGEVDYSAEFVFTAGKLFNETLEAGGWIDVRQSPGEEVTISGLFGVARNGDWKDGNIFPECVGVQAQYDLNAKAWELWIDAY